MKKALFALTFLAIGTVTYIKCHNSSKYFREVDIKFYKEYFMKDQNKDADQDFESQPSGVTSQKYDKEFVVSLTSFPPRIERVFLVIESIMRQKLKPNRIVLYLTDEEFPDHKIPKTLQQQMKRGLEVRWTENLRSFTKLLPALKDFPESMIFTVDDDVAYDPNTLNAFYKNHLKYPKCIISTCTDILWVNDQRELRPYARNYFGIYKIDQNLSEFPIIFGISGALYPPHSLHKEIHNKELFKKLCYKADDLWFWAMAVLNDTKIKLFDQEFRSILIPIGRTAALSDFNLEYITPNLNNNNIQLHNIMKHFHLYEKFNIKPHPETKLVKDVTNVKNHS